MAGFIGVETAENLIERGIDVTLIDFAKQILPGTSDFEMANMLHAELSRKGMNLVFDDLVSEFADKGKTVKTKNGLVLNDTDLIVMAAGV